jgi:hypothetical protein
VCEVRPGLLANGRNCVNGPPREKCVLLSALEIEVIDSGSELGFQIVDGGDHVLIQDQRPYLLQSQLIQETLWNQFNNIISGGPSGSGIDETNLMHLTGTETVEGEKTFSDPIALLDDGRVRKRIMLSPSTAYINSPATVDLNPFRAGIPALEMSPAGEITFNVSVPDDIEYALSPELRLCWGYTASTGTTDTVTYEWQIRNRFAEPGIALNTLSGGPANVIGDTETDAEQGRVYVTNYVSLSDAVGADDVFGAIRIRLNSLTIGAAYRFYLLHVELRYVANRFGRPI